jgi:hypothetical protein
MFEEISAPVHTLNNILINLTMVPPAQSTMIGNITAPKYNSNIFQSVPVLGPFDAPHLFGGNLWMVLYYPLIFGNMLLCVKILELGSENGWGQDLTLMLAFSSMFIIMLIEPFIWFINHILLKTVVI